MALDMRAPQPEALFAVLAEMGAQLAAQRAAAPGVAIEPAKIND